MSCISSNLCKKNLFMNLEPDCRNKLFSGISSGSIIFAKDDIESVTYDSEHKNLVTDITLKSDSKAWKWIIDSKNPFTGTNTAMNANDQFSNDFTHTLSGLVLTNGTLTTEQIEVLSTGKFVVIIENDYIGDIQGDYYHYQIYGLDKGLQASAITTTKYENQDAFTVELQEANTPNAGRFFLVREIDGSNDITVSQDSNLATVAIETTGGTIAPAVFDVIEDLTDETDGFKMYLKGTYNDSGETGYFSTTLIDSSTTTAPTVSKEADGTLLLTFGSTDTPSITQAGKTLFKDGTCAKLRQIIGETEEE